MPQKITLQLLPREAANPKHYTALAARRLGISDRDIALVRVIKRSIDARRRQPLVNLSLEIYVDQEEQPVRRVRHSSLQTQRRRMLTQLQAVFSIQS